LDGWKIFFKKDLTTSNLSIMIPDFSFYEVALSVESETSTHLFDTAIRFISEIEENQWPAFFAKENSYELRLLVFLLKNGLLNSLPEKSIESYKSRLQAMAKETETLTHDLNTWDILYAHIDQEKLKETMKNVRDSFVQSGNINPTLFRLFEKLLRESLVIVDKPTEIFDAILTKIIEDKECFKIVLGNSLYYRSLFSYASGTAQLSFLRRFRLKKIEWEENDAINQMNTELNNIISEKIKIKEARYFTDDHSVDVTSKMKQIVERERTLQFVIDNGIVDGRDIHPDIAKKFTVSFDFDGTGYENTYNENEWVSLP